MSTAHPTVSAAVATSAVAVAFRPITRLDYDAEVALQILDRSCDRSASVAMRTAAVREGISEADNLLSFAPNYYRRFHAHPRRADDEFLIIQSLTPVAPYTRLEVQRSGYENLKATTEDNDR